MSYLTNKDLANQLGGQPGDDIRAIFKSAIEVQNVGDGYGLVYQATLDTDGVEGYYVPVGFTSEDPKAVPAKWIKGYISAVFTVTQTSTNNPVINYTLVNEIGGTPGFVYGDVGEYTLNFTGAPSSFVEAKTITIGSNMQGSLTQESVSGTSINLQVANLAGSLANGVLNSSIIEVRVYP